MKKFSFLALIVCAVLLSSCGVAATGVPQSDIVSNYAMPAEKEALQAPMLAATAAPAVGGRSDESTTLPGNAPQASSAAMNRVVIMNAMRSMFVNDPQITANAIAKLAAASGGWVVNSNINQSYFSDGAKHYSGTIAIRIPAEKLDATLAEIEKLAVEVTSRQQSGQDVTAEYTDLKARLTNKEATAEQLRAMIADLRGSGYETDKPEVITAKVQALAQLSGELDRVQGEIESMKGQIKYYEESSAYSIITVDLQPYIPSQPIEIAGWHPDGTAKQALEDLIHALQGIADFFIRFAICGLPALLFLALVVTPFVLIARALIRRYVQKPK